MNSGALRGSASSVWRARTQVGILAPPHEHLKHRYIFSSFSQCLVLCLVWRTHHHHHHQNKHCAKCFTCKSLRHYWCVFYKKGK